jgi:plasmid maintenance system antidote protein VapI
MPKTALSEVREMEIEDVKADIRHSLFRAIRSVFRRESHHIQAKDLAASIGRDPGFVSRVLNGQTGGITAETAAVFLDALGYQLRVQAVRKTDLAKSNWDCRVQSASTSHYRHEGFAASTTPSGSGVRSILIRSEASVAR